MNKQMKTAMAAMLMVGAVPMMAQQSQTDVVKVAPGQKKTTVIQRKNGATDTVVSEGVSTGAHKKRATRRKTVARREPVESQTSRELRELRDKQAAQQAQIDALTQANAAKDAALAQAQQDARGAEAQAQAATSAAQTVSSSVQANTDAVQKLQTNVSDLQTTNAGLANTIIANKVELTEKIESPLAIHYKGVTITPVGFFALEGVYRQRSINSDINTPFNTTPYQGANEARVSEFNFTGRQSRLGGLFEGKAANFKLSGYFESDFLSSGTTSNENQSNSYTLRVRQIWGKAETNSGFAVTGGQTWTLLTENGKSTDVRTEKLPNTIDPSYMVGYTWSRQPGIRIQQKLGHPVFGAGVTIALAAEQAQIIYSTPTNAPTNFFFGGAGVGGGLFNATANYANDIAPDVIAKIATDSKHTHFEVAGIGRFFRDRIYPAVAQPANGIAAIPGALPTNNTVFAGGGLASARISSKYLDVALNGMVGDGIGKYGSGQLTDITVHPNGRLEPVRSAHGLFSLESHPAPKLDIYAYYGGEYAQRTQYATGVAATPFTGYGTINSNLTGCNTEVAPTASGFTGTDTPAGTCAASTRYLQEGMAGFTYRVVSSPKYGRLQYQATYSYLTKSAWTGVTAGTYGPTATFGSPKAVNNMIHVGMRYYIP